MTSQVMATGILNIQCDMRLKHNLFSKSRKETGDVNALCYQVPRPPLSAPEHTAITSKHAWARHHTQNHGSLLCICQAPNNWFLYPITLHKGILSSNQQLSRRCPGTPWEDAWGLSVEKNWLPAKILPSLPTKLLFLSENSASCQKTLCVGHSHFSLAPCQDFQEINLLQFHAYKRKRHVRIHTISWAHSPIIKVIFNLPAFYQTMNHFYTDRPLCALARKHFKCVTVKYHEYQRMQAKQFLNQIHILEK